MLKCKRSAKRKSACNVRRLSKKKRRNSQNKRVWQLKLKQKLRLTTTSHKKLKMIKTR